MARGQGSRLPHLLTIGLIATACTAVPAPATSTEAPATTTTTPPLVTTTTVVETTTTQPEPVELPEIDAVIKIPEGEGPFPAVVLAHGGGWVTGDPGLMTTLQNFLTDEGYVTVNTRYALADNGPGFPTALEDVACAINHARAMPETDGTVVVIGHSAGAHLGAVVALTGSDYAANCPVPGNGTPEKLVGLAGPYDVDRLGLLMIPFFGVSSNVDPDIWLAGNPQRLTDRNPDLMSLIMFGDRDGLVDDSFAIDFHAALVENGVDSTLEVVEGARHMNMRQPDWVGDLIAVWLER